MMRDRHCCSAVRVGTGFAAAVAGFATGFATTGLAAAAGTRFAAGTGLATATGLEAATGFATAGFVTALAAAATGLAAATAAAAPAAPVCPLRVTLACAARSAVRCASTCRAEPLPPPRLHPHMVSVTKGCLGFFLQN
jgi:hypothetical protein